MHTVHRVELPEGPIHYRELGSGPPIVFVHGLLVDGRAFGDVPELLAARGFRCLVPDWPLGSHKEPLNAGADLTPRGVAKLIANFLEALDLRGVTLVGNDSGGALSQMVCAWHSERVARLVLTTCDAFEVFPPRAFAYLLVAARMPGVMALLSLSMRLLPVLARLPIAYGMLTKKRLPSELLASWVAPTAQPPIRRDVAKFLVGIDGKDLVAAAEELKKTTRPVLLVWTPEDGFFPVSLAHRLREAIPHAQLELVDDARVFVSLDQPERVASVIGAALERATAVPSQTA